MFARPIPPRSFAFLGLDSPGRSAGGLVMAQGIASSSPEPSGVSTGVLLVGGIIVAVLGVAVWMWNKDQTRLAAMTPEARHQENMDRLATGATYSLISAVSDR